MKVQLNFKFVLLMRIARLAQNGDTFPAQSLVARISIVINIIVISTVHHLIGPSSFDNARNSAACLLDQSLKNKSTQIYIHTYIHTYIYIYIHL